MATNPKNPNKTVSSALRARVAERVLDFVGMATGLGVTLPMPFIRYDLKGTPAGMALPFENELRFNPVLLNQNVEHFLAETVGHEVAHLVTHLKYGDDVDAHGSEWQRVMRAFKLHVKRCHNYDVSDTLRMQARYGYNCLCRHHLLATRTHNKIQQRKQRNTCRTCDGELRYDGKGPKKAKPPPRKLPVSTPALATPPAVSVPVRPPLAPQSTPGATLPTAAMLRYAESLARAYGLPLPKAAQSDYGACSRFIEQLKPSKGQSAEPPPTPKQLAYAESLAKRKGISLPPEAQASKSAISRWIAAIA